MRLALVHSAYAKELKLRVEPSQTWPKGALSQHYEVYRDDMRTSERALYVIDSDELARSLRSRINQGTAVDGASTTGREVGVASVAPQPSPRLAGGAAMSLLQRAVEPRELARGPASAPVSAPSTATSSVPSRAGARFMS